MHRLATRLTDAAILIWIIATIVFVLVHVAPGDPAALLVGPTATADDLVRQRRALGLDDPLATQYARWIGGVLRGDFGTSIASGRPVSGVILDALPVSLFLGGISLALSFTVGIAIGAVQALRVGPRMDTAITVASTVAYAAPSFWLALALVAVATSGAAMIGAPPWLRLPAFGIRDPAGLTSGWNAIVDAARHAILPLVVLTVPGAAGIARYARAAMVDARDAVHVRAARARGLPRQLVERRYVLRTSLGALIVLFGLTLPGVIAGSVFVEQVFAWPGLGRLMLTSIAARDYPVVLALAIAYGASVVISNALADVLLAIAHPRRSG